MCCQPNQRSEEIFITSVAAGECVNPKTKSFEVIETALKDPVIVAKLHFMLSVDKQLQQFVLDAINFGACKIIIMVLEKSLHFSF